MLPKWRHPEARSVLGRAEGPAARSSSFTKHAGVLVRDLLGLSGSMRRFRILRARLRIHGVVTRNNECLFWLLAVLFGVASGYLHVIVPDPTIVALTALVGAMFLGFARPQRPGLWALILALSIPSADLVMYLRGMAIYRGRLEGAFVAGLVSGIVGSYAGWLGRRTVTVLMGKG